MANRRSYLVVVLSDYLRDHPRVTTLWKGPQAFVASALGAMYHADRKTISGICEHVESCDCMGIVDVAELGSPARHDIECEPDRHEIVTRTAERDLARDAILSLAHILGVSQESMRPIGGTDEEWRGLSRRVVEAATTATSGLTRLAVRPGYEDLAIILDEALEQAQAGKGYLRHGAGAERWDDQVIGIVPRLQGHPGGVVYQVVKKVLECERMVDPDARYREALGAIVYAAGLANFVCGGAYSRADIVTSINALARAGDQATADKIQEGLKSSGHQKGG